MIKNPVRRSAALALLFLMLASMCLWAEFGQTEQDLDVLMLFTDEYRPGFNYSNEYKSSDKTLSKKLYEETQARVLTAAVYLCVDATKNDKAITKVKESHMMIDSYIKERTKTGLKYTVDEIIRDGDSGGNHEKYTHMGWHYYEGQLTDKNQKEAAVCWYKRRYILQQAVNVLFKFNPIDEWISLQQCKILMKCADKGKSLDSINIISRAFIFSGKDERGKGEYRNTKSGSLAALFYYTHILGDIIDNKEGTADTRMSIYGVQEELKKHLYNLFGESAVAKDGGSLDDNLTTKLFPYEPKKNPQKKGIPTDQNNRSYDYIRYWCDPALELLQSLQKNLGTLLGNETFYTESELYKPAKQVNSISPPLPKVAAIFVQWREKAVNTCPPSPLIPLRRRYALA